MDWLRRPWAGLGARDWAVAALAVAAASVQVSVGSGVQPSPPANAVASVLAFVGGVALAWRRRRPVLAVAVSICAVTGHDLLVGPTVPVVGWLAVLAIARHVPDLAPALRGAALTAVAVAAGNLAAGLIHRQTGGLPVVLSLTLAVLLAAASIRLQAARVEGQRREREAARQQAVAAERLRIARDLHDLVGHGLSTVAIQSSAARLALACGDTAAALRAVASVEQASRGSLAEMRQLLGVLRHGDDPPAPAPSLDGIDSLGDDARAAGHPVSVRTSGHLEAVPAAAALCAYRVAQEAVTNTMRHAAGAAIAISLDVTADTLTVEVTDDGAAAASGDAVAESRPRYGLLGLGERVGAAGGIVEAGPRPGRSGWRVTARIPLGGGAPR